MKSSQTKNQIEDAIRAISAAAQDAVKTIASAASEAKSVVASNAAEAAKVLNVTNSGDHDLLQRVDTKVDALKEDIRELKGGTSKQIDDHEIRLNSLETSKTKQNTMMAIGIGILTLLVSLLTYHLVN